MVTQNKNYTGIQQLRIEAGKHKSVRNVKWPDLQSGGSHARTY